jgi:predicted esterase
MIHSERLARLSFLLCLWLLATTNACGEAPEADEDTTPPDTANGGSGSPTLPGGTTNSAGGAPNSGAPSGGTEGNPTLGGIGSPSSNPPIYPGAGAGGNASTPMTNDPDVSGPPAPEGSGLDPIIPEPSGACPEFRTGTQTILGLTTEIVAGEPTDTPGPLLFTWHGTGGSGRQALLQLPQSVQRDIAARGGIVIAPSDNGQVRDGADVTFVLGVWYDGADLAFADQIVACAVQNHNIDPRQIYVTGCSAGGLMAGVMALERSSYVAAAAPNSGGITAPTFPIEDRTRVPAVMTMHGGAGDNVIVNFGDTSRQLASVLGPLGSFIVDCNHNSGHCGAPASLHEKAWDFLLAHPFGTQPSPFASGLPGDFPEFCAVQ